MRVLAICGSLQEKSGNLELLRAAVRAAEKDVVEVVLFDGLRELPPFNPDLEEPPAVAAWRTALSSADAVLIASPEYGHSLPGSLKNAVDWVIGTGELERKIVAITAAVPGPDRGRLGLKALRDTLGAVSATVVGGEPIVRGEGFDESVARLLQSVVETVRAQPRDA